MCISNVWYFMYCITDTLIVDLYIWCMKTLEYTIQRLIPIITYWLLCRRVNVIDLGWYNQKFGY